MVEAKPFGISKRAVWEPYERRRSRTVLREAAGEVPAAYSPTPKCSRRQIYLRFNLSIEPDTRRGS